MRHLSCLLLMMIPVTGLAIELDGQTDFARRLAVNSSISARIDSIRVAAGQRVSAGEVVVTLVRTGLQFNADSARAEAEALAPAAERALVELEKARELFARDSLAAVELQNAEQHHAAARARLEAAEARLAQARFLLSQADIRSPIDGVVLEVGAFAGQYINTRSENQTLLIIVDDDSMIATARMPYELAKPGLVGRPASLRYGDRKFNGRIIEVGREAASGDNNHPAVILRVAFASGGSLAAGLPVRITFADQ